MNKKLVASFFELVQIIGIGWFALYGVLSFTGDKISIFYGRATWELATGFTFLCIAAGLLKATWESVFTSGKRLEES